MSRSSKKSELTSEVVVVTPEIATGWLEKNTHNRPIRQAVVDRYTRDMKAGKWLLTHQGIAFNCDDVLIDGQHRLWAVIESGASVAMVVTSGMPVETQLVIDDHRSRDVSDFLTLAVGKVTQIQGAVLKIMLTGADPHRVKLTHQEIMAAWAKHESVVRFATGCFPGRKSRVTTGQVYAVIARARYSKYPPEEIRRFCEVLYSGVASPASKDGAAILLREALLTGSHGRPLHPLDCYRKTQSALLAFLERRSISKLQARDSEVFRLPNESAGYRPAAPLKGASRSDASIVAKVYRYVRDCGKPDITSTEVALAMNLSRGIAGDAIKRAGQNGWIEKSGGKRRNKAVPWRVAR